jgi:rhodanese-related sulfurtransferase
MRCASLYFASMKLLNVSRTFLALFALTTTVLAADAPKIGATEAAKLVAEGKAVLVDCREPNEWNESGVAAPAVLLPKSDFDGEQKQWKEFLAKNSGKQIIVYCRTGRRSASVANALAEKGLPAANAGGLRDWTKAGLPTRPVEAPASASAPESKR